MLALGLTLAAGLVPAALALAQADQPAGMAGQAPPGGVSGPGQAGGRPAAQCPRAIACQYAERNLLPNGYRLQSLQVCGANCTTQYWVSASGDGQQLLEIDPVRGGGVLAVARATPTDDHPQVRSVLPAYADGDPACCPSAFADTTYTWDPVTNTLLAGEPILTPAPDFPGWDAVRQALLSEGWLLANV